MVLIVYENFLAIETGGFEIGTVFKIEPETSLNVDPEA